MDYDDYSLVYMVNENEEVFDFMIKKYEPLFRKLAYSFVLKYKSKNLDIEDLVQHCRIIFCKVLDTYNYDNDILFFTYLVVCLKRAIINYIKRNLNKEDTINYMDIDQYDNLDYFVSSLDVFETYADYEFEVSIINFKNSLSFLDAQIFELRYNGFRYREIAELLEINTKKVDNSLLKIRKKLEKQFLFL